MIVDPGAEFVAFDLETTGLSPQVDRVVEIGAVRFLGSGEILATFERLVNPLQPSSTASLSVHKISDEALAQAQTAEAVLPDFVAFLGDPSTTTLLAHQAAFDAGFLGRELIRAGIPLPEYDVIDTLAWARRKWPNFGSHKLEALAKRLGPDPTRTHRALVDSDRVRRVFLALMVEEEGQVEPAPLAYPIFDGAGPPPVPRGWNNVAEAIGRDEVLRIEYAGGTRGIEPRDVSPKRFAHRGGVAYLVAVCHLDQKVKEFQIDRVRSRRLIGPEA